MLFRSCRPAELRFADQDRGLTLYILGRAIHLRRLSDGKDVVVRVPSKGPVHAQIEPTGLFYSSGNQITFVPRSEIDSLLPLSHIVRLGVAATIVEMLALILLGLWNSWGERVA